MRRAEEGDAVLGVASFFAGEVFPIGLLRLIADQGEAVPFSVLRGDRLKSECTIEAAGGVCPRQSILSTWDVGSMGSSKGRL